MLKLHVKWPSFMQFRPSAPLEYRGADEGSFQLSRWYELKMEDYVALQAHFYAVFGHDLSIYAVPATFSSRKKSSHQNFSLWIALAICNEYKWPHLSTPGTRMVVSFLPTIILFKSLFFAKLNFSPYFSSTGRPTCEPKPGFFGIRHYFLPVS